MGKIGEGEFAGMINDVSNMERRLDYTILLPLFVNLTLLRLNLECA